MRLGKCPSLPHFGIAKEWDLSGAPVLLLGVDGQTYKTQPTTSLAQDLESWNKVLESPSRTPSRTPLHKESPSRTPLQTTSQKASPFRTPSQAPLQKDLTGLRTNDGR